VRKLILLRATGRSDEALRYAMNLDQDPLSDLILHQLVKGELGRLNMLAGRVVESISYFDDALEPLATQGDRAANFGVRARLFEQCGALNAAVQAAVTASKEAEQFRKLVEILQPQDEHTKMQLLQLPVLSVDDTQARVCFARGDTLGALTHAHRGVARVLALGVTRIVLSTLGVVAGIYGSLGLLGDARWFAHRASEILENSPGDLAWWTRWLGARDMEEGQIQAAITRYESAVSLYQTAAREEHGAHGRASWLREAAVVLFDDLAPLSDAAPCCAIAEDLLADAARAADEAASPEQRALTQRSRAALAEARKQWDVAETGFLSFLTWAEANWGPYKRAEVLLDLARVARESGNLPQASVYAERAEHEVALDSPEYRNRYVAIAAARELARIRKAEGDSTRAHAALDAALSIARGDDLRLREREILLDLAELLPPLDGPDRRIEHAQRARSIAQGAAFPVDEAEAMLVLAELHHDAGDTRRARALFEQAVWIVDRIGPRAVRERASRLRDKLDG
jgi:tetratricopeptide (TPR) repeat protein